MFFYVLLSLFLFIFFFFNDTATTEIYTLSLHHALPISDAAAVFACASAGFLIWNWPPAKIFLGDVGSGYLDRKSTRLNSSHLVISYAVFCLKKKKLID